MPAMIDDDPEEDELDTEEKVQIFLRDRLQSFDFVGGGPMHLCIDDGNCDHGELERELLAINACLLHSILVDMGVSHADEYVDSLVRPHSAWTADSLRNMRYFADDKGLRELVASKTTLEAALEYYYDVNKAKEGWGDNEPEFNGVDRFVP